MSAMQYTFGIHIPIAVEIALLAVTWYVSSALTRIKLWLIPSVGFAIGALLIPTNSFWILLVLTPVLALSGVAVSRFADRSWSLPFYIVTVISAVITGYTGYTQDHLLVTSLALLGFAALAYIIGVIEKSEFAMWIMPAFAIWSVIISAGFLGDLYRPPIVALVCAALGVSVKYFRLEPMPFFGSVRRNKFLTYALPFYATALAAAILTGVYGTVANINNPFYGAVPDALLIYALVAFAVLIFERQPRLVVVGCWFCHLEYFTHVRINCLLPLWHRTCNGSSWTGRRISVEATDGYFFNVEIPGTPATIYLELALVFDSIGCCSFNGNVDITTLETTYHWFYWL